MHILIAPDSFKGSLSAHQVIEIITNKLEKLPFPVQIESKALADGGEGSLEVIEENKGFEKKYLKVFNPLYQEVEAWYLYQKKTKTAYIEMAKASGLMLVNELNVMNASSFGTGQLMKHAVENGAKKIILFIGGSATNDAGTGIAKALGIQFYDKKNTDLKPIGKNLLNIHSINDTKSVSKKYRTEILIAADVNNPFYGKKGGAHIYAPQKGANKKQVLYLDKGLQNIAAIFANKYAVNVQKIKGSGAAGGIGGGMIAMFGAKLISGSELIFELTDMEQKVKLADLIITGEGKIDEQTLNDKLIFKLSKLANKHRKKIWAVCGYYSGNEQLNKLLGIEKVFSLAKSKNEIAFAINNTELKLTETATEVVKEIIELRKRCKATDLLNIKYQKVKSRKYAN